jgi:hypothetical protein
MTAVEVDETIVWAFRKAAVKRDTSALLLMQDVLNTIAAEPDPKLLIGAILDR